MQSPMKKIPQKDQKQIDLTKTKRVITTDVLLERGMTLEESRIMCNGQKYSRETINIFRKREINCGKIKAGNK